MKLGKYRSLYNDHIHSTFMRYFNALEMPIIDYIAIGVQDTIHKTSASLMSLQEWQSTFSRLEFAEHDPIRKASFNVKANFFTFDEIDYIDTHGKEIMRQRKKHGLANGIVILNRNMTHNFMLTLATGYRNFSAHKFFIDQHLTISKIFNDLITLILPDSKCYIPDTIHHSDDAK